MAAILQTAHSNAFSWMKMFEFTLKFPWSLFLKVQYSSIGSDDGLVLTRWQAIIWTNDYYITDIYIYIYMSLGFNELNWYLLI